MKKMRLFHFAILGLLLVSYTNCTNARLGINTVVESSYAGVNFCTTPAQSIQSNLKYLFVIDHSGSNQQNYIPQSNGTYIPDPAGGTDPNGLKRFAPLVTFLQGITDNPNTFYASISFADAPTQNLAWSTGGVRTTAAQAITYFQSQMPPVDGGNTDYLDTLNMIQNVITSDVQAAVTAAQGTGAPIISSDYVIIWISDGAPYVNGVLQPTATIYGDVQAIMALKTQYPDYVDSITLSTGFYTTATPTPEQQTASNVMSQMATYGQGSFIFFSTNSINYTDFSVPARNAKFVMRDFWIQNANTVWWNGKLMLDSDGDGIPDSVELTLGSDPHKYDSDGNGVGDGVEYYLYGTPCKDAACATTNARNLQAQCGAMPVGGYLDSDNDFLNNCEENLLGSKSNDFDSNQDWVPDQFEWISQVSFVAGSNSLLAMPMNDGMTNYQKMKQNLPVNVPVSSLSGYIPMSYQISQVSDNPSQTCFQVQVQNIASITGANSIRAYIMESRGATGNVRHMRVAQKQLSNGQLQLSDGDFSP